MNRANLQIALTKGKLAYKANEAYELTAGQASAVRLVLIVDKDRRYVESEDGGIYYHHREVVTHTGRSVSKVLFKRIDGVWIFNSQYSMRKA